MHMKIAERIRRLLAAKDTHRAPNGEDAPPPPAALPHEASRPAVEPSSAPASLQRPPVSPTKQDFLLEGEGIAEAIPDPSTAIIRRELERLRTASPSFVALVSSEGSYLQAAGNARRMTVEAHVVRKLHTTHVVLGRQGPPGSPVTLGSSMGQLDVRTCEVWSAPEAAELFAAFAATGSISPDLSCRDITEELASS